MNGKFRVFDRKYNTYNRHKYLSEYDDDFVNNEWVMNQEGKLGSVNLILQQIMYDDDDDISLDNLFCTEKDGEIIKRYTVEFSAGLFDIHNRKDVFENDILNLKNAGLSGYSDLTHSTFGRVVFDEDLAAFMIQIKCNKNNKYYLFDFVSDYDYASWLVVGNIHHNPELLER